MIETLSLISQAVMLGLNSEPRPEHSIERTRRELLIQTKCTRNGKLDVSSQSEL